MIRYRVFISSTIDDLQPERNHVDEELKASEIFDPIRVENLPAIEDASRYVCLREVADADATVIVLKDRYGFVPKTNNPEELSVTHLEYREARRLKKPIFAFLYEGVEPELRLQRFVREISDFDHGVLRKRWKSIDQLRNEVRRALLFWVARRAREKQSPTARKKAVEQLVHYPELTEFRLVVDAQAEIQSGNWFDNYVQHLTQECKQRLLPMPRITERPPRALLTPDFMLRVQRSPAGNRLLVGLSLRANGEPAKGEGEAAFPIEIDAAETSEGARFVAQASLALVLVAADDWSRGIDGLFDAAASRNASKLSKANLLSTAAYISAFHRGERSFDVVRKMLSLPNPDAQTISAGIMSLKAAEVRFERARARHALAECGRLAVRLLLVGLSQREVSSEILYNLARESLKHFRRAALEFYGELLHRDPSYDERWYFHRDIGLIYYAVSQFSQAAKHYDLASHLKPKDSELLRFAGDAYYYRGLWAEALIRYERAVEIEPAEMYFLDAKIEFARKRLRKPRVRDRGFRFKRSISHLISRLGNKMAESGMKRIAQPLFLIAKSICELNFDAHNWLALYANRGRYFEEAIAHLKAALTAIPEDPSTRLNLVANMIWKNNSSFTEEAQLHAKISIFHGGRKTRDQFRLRLVNTQNREELSEQFNNIFRLVEKEREEWRSRRLEVLKPEVFGHILHFELRE